MDNNIQNDFDNLEVKDKNIQYEAYNHIMKEIDHKVEWAYEVWDELVKGLRSSDNHKRSRCAQFLAGLAKSDPDKRIMSDFPALWQVTKDEKFVTARHALQSIWKVGLAGDEQQEMVIQHVSDRFKNCQDEKNHTLIRFDIIQGLRNLYDATEKEEIKQVAHELIQIEQDPKYQKKYAKVWK
ncbi:hypothetical protein [Oceanobacillus saliphilus]|uniref:hypothetical protein n=1 Tax=Oceanobacillus saliphilus TaxID=2925834 RepID=UPI00201DCE56|nr:hypothetical protein [Oceanobacillus saliphilus]